MEKQRTVVRNHVFFSPLFLGFVSGCEHLSLGAFTEGYKEKDSPNGADLKQEAADLERRQKNYMMISRH